MVRKYLVGQYCKNEVFVLNKVADDFEYRILHYLMENNLAYNKEVDSWYGIYLYYFYFVEKIGNFHCIPVKILVDHENLLKLNSFVVYFDSVKSSFEYLS